MHANVLVLIFATILKIGLVHLAAVDSTYAYGDGTEFPFAQAKVKYHRSRYCITAFGETNCVRMEKSPGDAAEIAKLYKLWMNGYEQDPSKLLRTMLRINKNIKKNKLRQLVKNKLSQRTKLSQLVKPGKLSQKANKAKLSQLVKQRKLRQRVDLRNKRNG